MVGVPALWELLHRRIKNRLYERSDLIGKTAENLIWANAWLRDKNRVEYTYATDDQALDGFSRLARLEGIIPALESSHAVAEAVRRAPQMSKDQLMIINLSGRGDKDVSQVADLIKL